MENVYTFQRKKFHTNFPLITVSDQPTYAGNSNQHWTELSLILNSTSLCPICFNRI